MSHRANSGRARAGLDPRPFGIALGAENLLLKRSGCEGPFMKRRPANAQWILRALIRASSVAVERYRKTLNRLVFHFYLALLIERS